MDKYIFDKNNGLWYELVGDYYFPCLTVPAEEEQSVGVWGYNALLLSGKLNSYLVGIDQQAQEMMETLIQQMAKTQNLTETLKANDQMAWVGRMNNVQTSATEILNKELIYA